MQRRLHIAVLMGGTSSEREVSFMSGCAIEKALREAGHIVERIEINGEDLSEMDGCDPDVAFIALHGRFGEDGQAQQLLEERGIPYTGSDPGSSSIAMNKITSKAHFIAAEVPTPDFAAALRSQTITEIADSVTALGLPVVVKPVKEGSSIGVSIVRALNQLPRALSAAFKYGNQAMIEEFIGGPAAPSPSSDVSSQQEDLVVREFTVGILGDESLPIIELIPKREFYNYEAKYVDDDTEYITDVQLHGNLYKELQTAALKAHRALGCSGFSRVDLMARFSEETNASGEQNQPGEGKGFYVLEVNTIPGFTDHSLLPKAAGAAGISFVELCDRIARLPLEPAARMDRAEAGSLTPSLTPLCAG